MNYFFKILAILFSSVNLIYSQEINIKSIELFDLKSGTKKLIFDINDDIILSTDKGSIMRCAVKEIRVAGRNTQGVRIKKLSGSEKVVSVIKIEDNIQ